MQRTISILLAMFAFFLLPANIEAQESHSQFYFKHINGEDGLSESNVKAILQDSYGFLWFGTKNGLNRYDGTSILQFNCYDPEAGVGNNNIGALYEDSQRNIWVGTDRGIYIYNPATDVFKHLNQPATNGVTPGNWVADILGDSAGNVWFLIPGEGIYRYQFGKEELTHYSIDSLDPNMGTPGCMTTDSKGDLWIGTSNAGLFKYNRQADSFEQHLTDRNGRSLGWKNIVSIASRGEDLVMAIYDGELMKYNTRTRELSTISFPGEGQTFLREVACLGDEIWLGSHHGLFVINEKKHIIVHLKEDLMRSFSLSDNIIYSIYKDNQGGIWIGTMFGGVNYLPKHRIVFDKYVPGSGGHSLNTKRIRGLAEDNDGNIWIGTEDNGINMLHPATGYVHQVNDHTPGHLITLCVKCYADNIFSGLLRRGMNAISLPSEQISLLSAEELGIGEGGVYDYLIDSRSQQWIGTGWGLYVKGPSDERYKQVDAVGDNWAFRIFEACDGIIWVATMGNGVWRCDLASGSFHNYVSEVGKGSTLRSNSVSSIMQDSKGTLWFSTDRGGISRYNQATDDFTSYGIDEGLPDDVCYDILEDDRHNLWFGTNKGLVRFHPETGDISVFTTKDGLLGNQFSYQSALKAHDGRFYFGGVDGLIAFNPLVAEDDDPLPPVYITRLSIYNKEVTVHTPHSPLKQSIVSTREIELPYNQSGISFDIAMLSYSTAETNQYDYRLSPLDKDWIRAASSRNISYGQLSPGKYTFEVKATYPNSHSVPSTRSLTIVILPPWWQSDWAYILYVLAGAFCVYGWFLWYERRNRRKMLEQQKLFEMEKEKELYESKVDFFTEIAHEVRTPLTLINGPLEAIQGKDLSEEKRTKYIRVMEQNTKRLLELTSQLLDFQKIDANKLSMKFEQVDITQLLEDIVNRFEVTFDLKGKELILHLPEGDVCAAVDREAITKIISNLLNNALKYAHHHILVELEENETAFTVRVGSDGNKIPAEASGYIFEPFYQMEKKDTPKNGFGIGLSLARSLASLHKGTLTLDTTHEDRNVFILTVPLNKENVKAVERRQALPQEVIVLDDETSSAEAEDQNSYSLLLVEDNESMLAFISERLRECFTVETALNGVEALEVLRSIHIDLVISDIMMPVMNGYQLCREVKTDLELSHIPIIFLTAKNDIDSKINGLKYGAEAYIEKPFTFDYLREQVLSLLDNRRREREAFAKRPFFSVDNMQMNKADEEFMNQVIHIIEDNITDDSFGVERLADKLCMSRSNLLRKIKTLFNLTPLDFIRVVRLKKAAEYIKDGKHRIGDIGLLVGINSSSYFTKQFQKQFGMSPKAFEQQCKSKKNGASPIDR